MKRIIIFLLIITGVSVGFSQKHVGSSFRTQSYYGFSGLMFIPTAQILSENQWCISYTSKPTIGADLTLNPYSVHISYGPDKTGLELAITNTPIYASKREFGGVYIEQGLPKSGSDGSDKIGIPISPSIKYQFMPMIKTNYYVAMACGFSFPYGAYYVVDKFVNVKFFDITIHTGVATKLTTYHAFVGASFTFGKRIGEIQRDYPFEILIEGSWGGSLTQLNEKEEAFYAISFRQAWTSSLFIVTFFRIDNQPLIEGNNIINNSPTKRMGMGLDFTWH